MKYVFIKKGDNLLFAFLVPFVLHVVIIYLLFQIFSPLGLIFISWIIAFKMFSGLKEIKIRGKKMKKNLVFTL